MHPRIVTAPLVGVLGFTSQASLSPDIIAGKQSASNHGCSRHSLRLRVSTYSCIKTSCSCLLQSSFGSCFRHFYITRRLFINLPPPRLSHFSLLGTLDGHGEVRHCNNRRR